VKIRVIRGKNFLKFKPIKKKKNSTSMKSIFKSSLISILLCLLPNSATIQACGGGFDHTGYAYQSWLFQTDLIPMKTLHLLGYPRLSTSRRESDPFAPFHEDTTFYIQNVAEWQAAIAADPAIPTKVADKDIHEILYRLDPEPYFRKMKKDSLRQNSFIKAIKSSKLANYLDFAKTCEQLMNLGGIWEEDGVKKKNAYSLKEHIQAGDAFLNQPAITPFIRERVAYQIVKMAHYLGDTARVTATYQQFLEKSTSKSWVIGSARYYDAVAHENPALKNLLLARTFEHSVDKRWLSLEHFDYSEELRSKTLALAENAADRARLMMMPVLLNEGRNLVDLKNIYQIHPQNSFIAIAIQREINKLENWILTNRFTEFKTSMATNEAQKQVDDDKKTPQDFIDLRNVRSDLQYLDELALFVGKIEAEHQQAEPDYWTMAVAHLAFLKKDFVKTKQYLAKIKDGTSVSIAMQAQKAVTLLLCDLYATPQLNQKTEQAILKFDAFLKQNETQIADYESFRSQIMRFLSERYIKAGQVAQGILILSKSSLTYGKLSHYWEKNFYHSFLETNQPQVIQTAIDLMTGKTAQTDFEKWLVQEPKPYDNDCWYCSAEERKRRIIPKWNIEKLKEYQSMLYLHRDQLDSAYSVLKTVPPKFWEQPPYTTYMSFDPFYYMLYIPDMDFSNKVEEPYYNKTTFIERLLELKQELKSDPKKYEQNYFLIGTAYYNMTSHGNYWLMSHIYHPGDDLFSTDSTFEATYIGCKYALEWFNQGVKSCENKSLAALCCFMAQECEHKRDKYEAQSDAEMEKNPLILANTPLWEVFKQRFKDAEPYQKQAYWCQHLEELMENIYDNEIKEHSGANTSNYYWYAGLLGILGLGGYAFYRRRLR
jgi:hypothetical protein